MKKKKEDQFIRENNEKKALKLAFKGLRQQINKEIVRVKRFRKRFDKTTKTTLLLGINHYNLVCDVLESSLGLLEMDDLDASDHSPFGGESSELKIWSIPIYLSTDDTNKDLVEVIVSAGDYFTQFGSVCEEGAALFDTGFSKRMDGYISKLPDSAKFKRVSEGD